MLSSTRFVSKIFRGPSMFYMQKSCKINKIISYHTSSPQNGDFSNRYAKLPKITWEFFASGKAALKCICHFKSHVGPKSFRTMVTEGSQVFCVLKTGERIRKVAGIVVELLEKEP